MTSSRASRAESLVEPSGAENSARLGRADRLQPVVLIGSVVLGLAIATAAPGFAPSLSGLVSVGVLVLIYLVMLGVDVTSVAGAFAKRRFLTVAVVVNFAVNPVLAWLLADVFLAGQPDLKVGLILFLVTPCIGWYLIFTELAGGDAGLGVSLLGINLVLQVLLLPLHLHVFAGQAATIELGEILKSVVVFLVVPAFAAAATRSILARSNVGLGAVQHFIGTANLKTAALAIVIVAMFASQADVLFDNPSIVVTLLPPMVAFFVIAFGVALGIARLTRLPFDQTALLVFTSTSRNSEASLAIAATAFASPLVALTVVIGPVIELPLLVLMVRVLQARRFAHR